MNAPNPRPQPELQENGIRQPQPDMLVQYPQSDKVTVVLSEPDAPARAIRNWSSLARSRARLLWNGDAASGIGGVIDLSPHLPWVVVGSGLVLVAFLWSTILL